MFSSFTTERCGGEGDIRDYENQFPIDMHD